jgi:hypothetical protein
MTNNGSNEYEQERSTEKEVEEGCTGTGIISIFMRLVSSKEEERNERKILLMSLVSTMPCDSIRE